MNKVNADKREVGNKTLKMSLFKSEFFYRLKNASMFLNVTLCFHGMKYYKFSASKMR